MANIVIESSSARYVESGYWDDGYEATADFANHSTSGKSANICHSRLMVVGTGAINISSPSIRLRRDINNWYYIDVPKKEWIEQ